MTYLECNTKTLIFKALEMSLTVSCAITVIAEIDRF